MLYDDPDTPEYYLWRMMIADSHQRKGYGKRVLQLIVDYVRSRPGGTAITVGAVPDEGSPQPFYESFGFVATGEVKSGEVILKLELS